MKVLVVDDEAPARRTLERAVSEFEGAECVASVGTAQEARQWLVAGGVDLVLLDVQMPEVTGFDLVRSTPAEILPLVVFVTAYDRYAIEAFDTGAVDYVLKPVEPGRIQRSLARAEESIRLQTARKTVARMLQVLASGVEPGAGRAGAVAGPAAEEALTIGTDGGMVRVMPADVLRIEAAGACCSVHTASDVLEARRSLADVERMLAPSGRHVRIHRSHVVAIASVERLDRNDGGTGVVTLTSGEQLPVSRQRFQGVRDRLGWG